MTAQIEQTPRAGVELTTTLPSTWRDVAAFFLCALAMVAVGAALLKLPGSAAVAVFLGLMCYLAGHVLDHANDFD